MKLPYPILLLIGLFLATFTLAQADVSVRGYYRKDGTYVAPHMRSSPNNTKNDNWSTRGNVNPYTGKAGTKAPDPSPSATPPAYSTPQSSSQGQTPNSPAPDPNKFNKAESWAKLDRGFNATAVRSLLGEPSQINGDIWRYPNKGLILFDGNGHVNGWILPQP